MRNMTVCVTQYPTWDRIIIEITDDDEMLFFLDLNSDKFDDWQNDSIDKLINILSEKYNVRVNWEYYESNE